MASLEQKLEQVNQQLSELDAEHKELLKKYRAKVEEVSEGQKELCDKNDKIADLKGQIRRLQAEVQPQPKGSPEMQTVIDNLRDCLTKKEAELGQCKQQQQQMQRTIDGLQGDVQAQSEDNKKLQSENDDLRECLKKKECELERFKQKQASIHELNDQVRRLSSRVQTLTSTNEEPQSKEKKVEESSTQKGVQLDKGSATSQPSVNQHPREGDMSMMKQENEQLDGDLPVAWLGNDQQMDTELIDLSDDDHGQAQEEGRASSNWPQRSVSQNLVFSSDSDGEPEVGVTPGDTPNPTPEVGVTPGDTPNPTPEVGVTPADTWNQTPIRQSSRKGIKRPRFFDYYDAYEESDDDFQPDDDEMEEDETPGDTTNQTPKGQSGKGMKQQYFNDEEDESIVDLLFNSTPEVTTLGDNEIWKRINQAMIKVDGHVWGHRSVKNRVKRALVEKFHRRSDLNTEKHRRVAKLCYAYFFKNDDQTRAQYMAAYDDARRLLQNGTFRDMGDLSTKRRTKYFWDPEIGQITHYIFNVHKPFPAFNDPYWKALAELLEKDNVSKRSKNGLRWKFDRTIVFELYKNKQLNTDEHRQIAILAFHTFGMKWIDELTEQYDFAREPGTTDEQIAQMESLAWKKKEDRRSTRTDDA